jgi:hemolysin D
MMKNSDYHDFKPILAEIEERPVNPIGIIFLWTIISLMVLVVLGLIFLKIDVVVSARGKIIPLGDVKIVQPLETGVIIKIHVKEGDYVKKGTVLLEIDPSIDQADLEGKERNLKYSQLSMARINAVLGEKEFNPRDKGRSDEVMKAQKAHFQAQSSAVKYLNEEIATMNQVLAMMEEDEKRLKSLVEIGAIADNRYRDRIKERMNLQRERDSKVGQLEQLREKLLAEYSTNVQGSNTLRAEVNSLRFRQEKRFIVAPTDGYIYLLPVKTIGGVVTTAQPVVGLVPENTPLEVSATVLNKDVGYIKEAQRCVIKVDTYDFQKYGTIEGEILVINPYSIEEKNEDKENNNEENERGGYPIRVKMQTETLKTKNGENYKVKPGMTVTAEINVGKRRVIEFFLFPIIRYLDEGLKVR